MAKDTKAEGAVTTPEVANDNHDQMYQLSTTMGRSMIAVIDAVCQRGGFRGEELSTIGQLRDQCVKAISMGEQYEASKTL